MTKRACHYNTNFLPLQHKFLKRQTAKDQVGALVLHTESVIFSKQNVKKKEGKKVTPIEKPVHGPYWFWTKHQFYQCVPVQIYTVRS